MPTAKSYENMEIICNPFEENGKMFVKVKAPCSRCGGSGHYSMNAMGDSTCYRCRGIGHEIQTVRWYTDKERAAMDRAAEKRAAAKAQKVEERRIKFAAKNAFGFGDEEYIWLVAGDNTRIKEWRETLPTLTLWYNEIFGWYLPSTREFDNLIFPSDIKFIKLTWAQVRNENDPEDLTMIDNDKVRALVEQLIYEPSKSQFQGNVNDWLEEDVVVEKNIELDSQYGVGHMHILKDAAENVYVWTTSSKNLEENSHIRLRMKVKDHKEYKGVKQTIVYYCKIK